MRPRSVREEGSEESPPVRDGIIDRLRRAAGIRGLGCHLAQVELVARLAIARDLHLGVWPGCQRQFHREALSMFERGRLRHPGYQILQDQPPLTTLAEHVL